MINNETIQNNFSDISTNSTSTQMMIETHSQLSNKDDMEPMFVHVDTSIKSVPKHPVQFTSENLRTHLEPIILKMIAWEYSYLFQQPINHVSLVILDYPKIIKHAMDISTIHNKLLHGEYKNPLEFCDDIWLMFNNAQLYNKNSTLINKMCTKLAELFVEYIDPVMQTLGYCCGRQYEYLPQVMLCDGQQQQYCQIELNDNYYYYNNLDPSRLNLSYDKYIYCVKCFNSIKNDSIFVGDDPTQTLVEIPKSLFLSAKNDIKKPEQMIDCIICTRRWHQVCGLHLDEIWSEGFICKTCIHEYNIKRKENPYIASKLPINDLASRLEQRVNNFLRNKNCQTGHVTIRILSASDKICEIKPQLKKYYSNQLVNNYPYRNKTIFAFQEIDNVDIVFFGMYVQEYDEHCPEPNKRRIYITYFDTVHFFQPKIYRTDIYHEILIGYLDYVKQHGYMYAHMWACPASKDFDYIFHCHPSEQHILKPKHLQDWCKKMLDKAIVERIVINYKDIVQDCLDNQVQTVLDIPYFDHDFWPFMIEDNIEKLNQEEEDRRKQDVEGEQPMIDEEKISDKCKSEKTISNNTPNQISNSTDLLSLIFSNMEKYKETFFVIRLHDQITSYVTVNDINDLIECDLMDTTNAFLSFTSNKNYEFSSLRRAKFSTMAVLYELYTSTTDKCTYSCNKCRQQCDIRYHCTVCEDFDLCEKCYNIQPNHEHKMDKYNELNIIDKSSIITYC
ncbi:unnamed protein product [Rotaria sordida]|uniref:histone acetyltransferase n=2 Tax=Rotaria sordida TaxID=392033 RepID=A0A815J6H1_9BILA|nr:unnamed protein product [Rotaria sordida]